MLYAYKIESQRLQKLDISSDSNAESDICNATWIDLIDPTQDERNLVDITLNQDLATEVELDDIEASARFFEDEHGVHIHSFFLHSNVESHVSNETVAFTIHKNRLFTLREREVTAFRLYRMRARHQDLTESSAYDILLDLFEVKIEQLADEIETLYTEIDRLGRSIMKHEDQETYNSSISDLAEIEDTAWKIRLCLMDSQRAINFLVRRGKVQHHQLDLAREISHDIESLLPHAESLFQKVNFLVQAAMGFINIEQSRIIKIFSVVSVIFLPPTLVASIYGMNFSFMPETQWSLGYPFSIGLMLMAAIAPYLFFKFKKWL